MAMPAASKIRRTDRARSERLEARITREQKDLLQRAADIEGRSLTDFVVAAAQDAAKQAIRDHEIIQLSVRDQEIFVDALLNPKPLTDRMRDTMRRYKKLAGA